MKRFSKIAACSLLMALGTTASFAVETTSSYQTIVDRNPFGLRPPESLNPPPQTNNAKAEPPKPKFEIKLTGLNTYGGKKKAYFFSKEPNIKNPYFSVAEGEAVKGIEVQEVYVNGKDKWVKVLMNGEEKKMTLKSDGLTNAPTIIPQPGRPGAPGMNPPQLGVGQPGNPNYPQPGVQPINTGNTIDPTTGLPVNNSGSPYTPNNNTRAVPSRSLRGSFNQTTPDGNAGGDFVARNPELAQRYGLAPNQGTPVQQVSPEEQFLRMKVNEEVARRANVPFPPLPGLPQ